MTPDATPERHLRRDLPTGALHRRSGEPTGRQYNVTSPRGNPSGAERQDMGEILPSIRPVPDKR